MRIVVVSFVVVVLAMLGILGYALLREDSRTDCLRAANSAPTHYVPRSFSDQAHCFVQQRGEWRDVWADK